MNIVQVNKFFYLKGGSEYVFFDTSKLLKEHAHKVSFLAMKHPLNYASEYEKYFVAHMDFDGFSPAHALKVFYSFEARRKMNDLIKDESPDIAHMHNIYHQISPSILTSLKKSNIPVVMTLHDFKMVCPAYALLREGRVCQACAHKKYYRCFLNKCVKNSRAKSLIASLEMYVHQTILAVYDAVDIFISPSLFLKSKLEEMGFKGKVMHLPNFVNASDFQPAYGSEEPSIVYFGRLSREKGLSTLCGAMRNVKAELKIIGEGPLKEELEKRKERENLKNIRFLKYMAGEDLKKEVARSMFAVFPSEAYENNPRSIIEAFALGKPVVASDLGGISELVRNNETGLLFKAGNTDELSSKIRCLLNSPAKITEMGKNCREYVETHCNAEPHYRRLMEIYEKAIALH